MVNRPTLNVAVAGTKNKASDYNENFDLMMDYVEDSIEAEQSDVQELLSIYQTINIPASSSGTVSLESNKIYRITPTGNITFSLPSPTTKYNTEFQQILVQLNLSTLYTVNVGTSYYFDLVKPTFSATGHYNITYEFDYSMNQWVCGVCKKGYVA